MRGRALVILALVSMLLGCGAREPYARKDGVWRFEKTALDVPAGERLTVLNKRFAKSKTRVWYRAETIPDADAASFQALDEHHARDATRAWYAETYRDGRDYFTTTRVRIRPLEGVDPARLRPLTGGYAVDGRQGFYEGVAFPVADPESFEVLDDGFARDRTQGYFQRQMIPGSQGASFQVLGAHAARDAAQVFYAEMDYAQAGGPAPAVTPIRGADPGTFQALEYGYGRDGAHAYHKARVLPGEVATFRVLDFGYARTAQAVFYNGEIVAGADPASFAILEPVTEIASARDRRGLYKDGRRVP